MNKCVCGIKFRGQDLVVIGSPEAFTYVKEQLENDRVTIRVKFYLNDIMVDRHYLRSDFEYVEFNYRR